MTAPRYTEAQHRQLHILRVTGWNIHTIQLDERTRRLHVKGADRYGDEFQGVIDPRGTLVGEPTDPELERFARSL